MNHRIQMRIIATLSVLCLIVALAACTPKTNTETDEEAGQASEAAPVVVSKWSVDSDCVVCHETQGATLDGIPCMAGMNTETACVSCHTDESGLASVHEGVTAQDKMPKRLKQTSVAESACESCHESYDELAVKSADSTVLTDSKGTVVNPHTLPSNENHDQLVCADCHSMHESGDVKETAPKACSGCHHAGVYECGTCHEEK